jgi:hypothetical protein
MPIWHDEYRDYRISYQGDQRAIIMPPNSETPLPDKIEAEPGEGRSSFARRRTWRSTPTFRPKAKRFAPRDPVTR